MKHFYLIVNREKKNAERGAELVREYLKSRGCDCSCCDSRQLTISRTEEMKYHYTDSRTIPPDTECFIVLGGDGTLIQAARDLAGLGIPFFCINMGHLGFLTQVGNEKDIIPALDELLADRYLLESRMMLKGRVVCTDGTETTDVALNDIVLSRMGVDAFRFNVYVNGALFNDYSADGIVVSTPTGSTAYNLSAGGPIAEPQSDLIILTPICPHTLNSRSLILGPDKKIVLEALERGKSKQAVRFDGETTVPIHAGDQVFIEKANLTARLVKLKEVPFLDNIRNKMKQI